MAVPPPPVTYCITGPGGYARSGILGLEHAKAKARELAASRGGVWRVNSDSTDRVLWVSSGKVGNMRRARSTELAEMKELLRRSGYNPGDAHILVAEGMGPYELEKRLKEVGGLTRTHGLKKRGRMVARKRASKKPARRRVVRRRRTGRMVTQHPKKKDPLALRGMVDSYIETALWSSVDDDGRPLDGLGYDLTAKAKAEMRRDVLAFWKMAYRLIPSSRMNQAAHDFWLTRNGHGAGFWDGDWPEHGDELTRMAKSFGTCDLYVSRRRIHVM